MLRWMLCALLVFMCYGVHAQTNLIQHYKDTAALITAGGNAIHEPGEDFNVFLFVLAIGFCGAALGAVMAGAFASFMLLSAAVLLTLGGIISASLLIGLYKRSVQAGFKSLLLIAASIAGSLFGLIVLWSIDHFFHLALTGNQLFLTGAGGGLTGGILLALIIYKMVKTILNIVFNKLKLIR